MSEKESLFLESGAELVNELNTCDFINATERVEIFMWLTPAVY